MADFNQAYERVARWEGGYQNSPNDPGNYNSSGDLVGTNFGVSAKKYEGLIGRPPTGNEMRNMPKWRAKDAFRQDEWNRIKGDTIQWQPLANILFDGVVNHGRGVKLLQEVLGIAQDNAFGPRTHAAVLDTDPQQLYQAYKERRRLYYRQLADRDPKLKVFLKGWLRRIDSFTDFISRTIKEDPAKSGITLLAAGLGIYAIAKKKNPLYVIGGLAVANYLFNTDRSSIGKLNAYKFIPVYVRNPEDGRPGVTNIKFAQEKSGVYILKEDNKIVYIGQSQTNLYRTVTRHFQEWNDSQSPDRITYKYNMNRHRYTVRIVFVSPSRALKLEEMLIRKHRPRDNAAKLNELAFEPTEAMEAVKEEYETVYKDDVPF